MLWALAAVQLALLVGVPGAQAQDASSQQLNNTGFVPPLQCVQSANAYYFIVQNGFGTRVNYTVVLMCDNAANTTKVLSAPPFGQVQSHISPSDQTPIANRICQLVLLGINPTDGTPVDIPPLPTSCGVIDSATYLNDICGDAADDDDWGDHCGFHPLCHAENGTATRSFTVLLIVMVFIFAIWGTVYTTSFLSTQHQRHKNLEQLAKISADDYANTQKALRMLGKHYSSLEQLQGARIFEPVVPNGGGITLGGGHAEGSGYYNAPQHGETLPPEAYQRGRSRGRSRGPPPSHRLPPHYQQQRHQTTNHTEMDGIEVVDDRTPDYGRTSAMPYYAGSGPAPMMRKVRSPPPRHPAGTDLGREDEDYFGPNGSGIQDPEDMMDDEQSVPLQPQEQERRYYLENMRN